MLPRVARVAGLLLILVLGEMCIKVWLFMHGIIIG